MWGKRRRKDIGNGEAPVEERFSRELRDLEEIAERLVGRVDRKIDELLAVESRVDAKVRGLDSLLANSGEAGGIRDASAASRLDEIGKLAERGLSAEEIAGIFRMHRGEVELAVNLGCGRASARR